MKDERRMRKEKRESRINDLASRQINIGIHAHTHKATCRLRERERQNPLFVLISTMTGQFQSRLPR